jgi:hypothetical protein
MTVSDEKQKALFEKQEAVFEEQKSDFEKLEAPTEEQKTEFAKQRVLFEERRSHLKKQRAQNAKFEWGTDSHSNRSVGSIDTWVQTAGRASRGQLITFIYNLYSTDPMSTIDEPVYEPETLSLYHDMRKPCKMFKYVARISFPLSHAVSLGINRKVSLYCSSLTTLAYSKVVGEPTEGN